MKPLLCCLLLWLLTVATAWSAVVLVHPFGQTGYRIESHFAFSLLPELLDPDPTPNFEFRFKFGQWSIQGYGDSTMMAYGGTLAPILFGYGTLSGGYWPQTAYVRSMWAPDGTSHYVGLFSGGHHQLLRIGWNQDGSLTVYDWAYESISGVELQVADIPETKWLLLAPAGLVALCFRRLRATGESSG